MYGFKPQHARGKPVQNYADGGLVNPLAGVGEYWSNSNAEFEAQNPNLLQRGVRSINPVTGFGSAVGAMHDGASVGSARDMAIAAMQAVPVFGAMRAVAPAVKTVAGAAPAVLVPSMAKTAARGAKGAAAGVAADEAQAQNFADGGIVHSIKGALGFRPRTPEELRAADAKSQARNQEAAAAVAERNRKTQPAPQQQSAVSGYAGMSAMQLREKELGLKDGGRVEPRGFVSGKGTGTSDSIKARLSNGEYVLPADTVKAVGVEALDSLRAATHTPVKHEQAKAARGFFAGGTPGGLDEEKLKNSFGDAAAVARDSSVAQVGGLANNGGADASRFAQVPAPIGTQPNRTPEPATPGAPLSVPQPAAVTPMATQQAPAVAPAAPSTSPSTLYMQDRAQELKDQVGQGNYAQAAGTAARTAVQGLGMYGIELANKAGTPLINAARGFGSGLLGSDANATPATPSTIASPPTSQTNPAAAPASTSLANAGRGVVNPPTINPPAPAPSNAPAAAPEIMPGVFKHGRGQYSDQSTGMGMPAGFTGQPSAANNAILQRMSDQSQAESMARVSAQQPAGFTPTGMQTPTVRHSGNDWQSRNDLRNAMVSATSIMNDGGKWDKHGKGVVSPERAYAMELAKTDAALRGAQPGVDVAAMRENAGIQREGMQQDGATTRTGMTEQGANTREAGRTALQRDEFNLRREASGFQTRAAAQQEQLRNTLIDPKATPEQRKQAQEYLQALAISGKEPSPQYKSHVMPAIRNADGSTTEGSVYQENTRTGEGRWVKPPGDGQAQQAMPKPASKAEFDALPKGTRFTDPNGQVRIK